MPIWKSSASKWSMPWGDELSWSAPWGVYGKIIRIKKGHRTSLKYYEAKSEVLYCLMGNAILYAPKEKEFGDKIIDGKSSEFYVSAGDVVFIQPENPYRLQAKDDCIFIEVTQGPQGRRDPVRLEDDYGRLDHLRTEPSRGKK